MAKTIFGSIFEFLLTSAEIKVYSGANYYSPFELNYKKTSPLWNWSIQRYTITMELAYLRYYRKLPLALDIADKNSCRINQN